MADKVRQFTIYRIKNLDRAEQEYYRTLQRTLDKIENDVVALAGRELPTQKKTYRVASSNSNSTKNKNYLTKQSF